MNKVEIFAQDSWAIENEDLDGSQLKEIAQAHSEFFRIAKPSIEDLENFAKRAGSRCVLRSQEDMNVVIAAPGGRVIHRPPAGGFRIVQQLEEHLQIMIFQAEDQFARGQAGTHGQGILMQAMDHHQQYETLHPFMDGNGRTGRLLWAWQCVNSGLDANLDWMPMRGFLQIAYYWGLQNHRASQGEAKETAALHTRIVEN